MEFPKGLSRNEIYSAVERMKADPKFPMIERVKNNLINFLNNNCPHCGLNIYENSRILRIKERLNHDYVRYVCKCGTAFTKYEPKECEESEMTG